MLPGFRFGENRTVDLAAFAHEPTDARSACLAVLTATDNVQERVISCRELGSPIVLALTKDAMQVWKQGAATATLDRQVPASELATFFRSNKEDLSPEAVYRAKTWGRVEKQYQLHFVDIGFMPVIEREIGERLKSLIERLVHHLRKMLWTKADPIPIALGQWFVKSAFWLVAAKILQDKSVPDFVSLDLLQVEEVFDRVSRHYDAGGKTRSAVAIRTPRERDALGRVAQEVAQFSHLGHVTTESLAHVYESALITRDTRAKLATHSTPPYLVDYLVGKLAPWIEEIPLEQRHVLEPACGHAAFLVASMRLLKDLLPPQRLVSRQDYLRKHLHGVEFDPFAVEIARLSLTLADIPNPDGWDLSVADMYAGSYLEDMAHRATIVLGNPPFQNFQPGEKADYARKGVRLRYNNKTAEVLGRVLPALPQGSVFGFVVPQGLLHSRDAENLRKLIVEQFEIKEICLFPDKVFSFSDAESAIVVGRRIATPKSAHQVSYRRVREPDMARFKLDYAVTAQQSIPQGSLCSENDWNLRVPDLREVWAALRNYPVLGKLAELGQGFQFRGRDLPRGALTVGGEGTVGTPGFAAFDVQFTHQLPTELPLNIHPSVIRRPGTGTQVGRPQVLLNYAPVSRGPWRLHAVIDGAGHAVTSRFITVRPTSVEFPLEYLWALLNCPLANAYAYAHSTKRQILVGMMRAMPVPRASPEETEHVAGTARRYLETVASSRAPLQAPLLRDRARRLLLQLDAEVLRLYELSPRLEREVLDLFAGQQRAGVPFAFDRYLPEGFEPWLSLHEYLSDEYQSSTAGRLTTIHEDLTSPALLAALRHAAEEEEPSG